MPRFLPALLMMLLYLPADAQPAWLVPANAGLPFNIIRYDDLYFWKKYEGVLTTPYGSVMKTYNGGESWSSRYTNPAQPYFRSIEALDGGQILVAGSLTKTTLRSTDSGETWTDISASIPDTGFNAPRICGLAHEGNSFYGVGWWGGNVARFYKSADAGATWQADFLDTAMTTGLVDIIAPGNGLLLAGGGRRYAANKQEGVILRSVNGGATWTKVFADTTIGGRIWKLQAVTPTLIYGSIEPLFDRDTVAIVRSNDGGQTWSIMPVGRHHTTTWGTQGIGFVDPAHGWVGGYYAACSKRWIAAVHGNTHRLAPTSTGSSVLMPGRCTRQVAPSWCIWIRRLLPALKLQQVRTQKRATTFIRQILTQHPQR